jgi:hypothetical protein
MIDSENKARNGTGPLLVSLSVLSTVGLVGLIMILCLVDNTERAVVFAGLLTAALTGILSTIMASQAATMARQAAVLGHDNRQELAGLVIQVNGRMDQLIEAASKAGLLAGHAEEKRDVAVEAQRVEAQRVEAQRVEAQRVEAQRVEAQRVEAAV